MAGDTLTTTEAPRTGAGSAPRTPAAPKAVPVRFIRRQPDQAQFVRRIVQFSFLLLNLWIGARFYFFVRFYETGGQSVWVPRPPGIEGWLPIAALMNLKYLLLTGTVPEVHAAGLFLFIAFLGITFAARKAFCSWLCPVGTISEWLWQGGREAFGRNFAAPKWLDIPLRGVKYLLMGFFLYAVLGMSVEDITAFVRSPYGLVADVKMLGFFRHVGTTAAVVLAVLVIGSVFVQNLWCRYLCPYGALLGLVSMLSPTRVRRDVDLCIDCATCAKSVSVAAAGRHGRHREVGRMHRLPRMRLGLPGAGRAATVRGPLARDPDLGGRDGDRGVLLRRSSATPALPATGTPRCQTLSTAN